MDYLVICAVALLASGVTLFSGFGLGTVLMPAFALFFPVTAAIAATAIVHFANNLFKLALVGRKADWHVVVQFGVPAVLAALAGAGLLAALAAIPPVAAWRLAGQLYEISPINLVIGALIVIFAVLELTPRFARLAFPRRYLFLGGILSGFFGGLTGNQGAFRSAFLIKAGLDKQAFVGTSTVTSTLVDATRLSVYGLSVSSNGFGTVPSGVWGIVVAACLAAFAGATLGARLLPRMTLRSVQIVVAVLMMAVGAALMLGIV